MAIQMIHYLEIIKLDIYMYVGMIADNRIYTYVITGDCWELIMDEEPNFNCN